MGKHSREWYELVTSVHSATPASFFRRLPGGCAAVAMGALKTERDRLAVERQRLIDTPISAFAVPDTTPSAVTSFAAPQIRQENMPAAPCATNATTNVVDISDEHVPRSEACPHVDAKEFTRPKTRSQDACHVAKQPAQPLHESSALLRKGLEQLKVADLKELLRPHGLK